MSGGTYDPVAIRAVEQVLNHITDQMGVDKVMKIIPRRPATVAVYNVSTVDGAWTAVATGLSGVLSWKLTDEQGNAFDYAFSAAPSAYMTARGAVSEDTEIAAVYVRRRTTTNVDAQLEVWSA